MASAPRTAARGSAVSVSRAPSLALDSIRSFRPGPSSKPRGEATRTLMPSSSAACASDRATLLPSPTEVLRQRQAVGQRLARMLIVRKSVDDPQPRRGVGERLEPALRVRPHDRAVDPALEVPGDVGDGLALAEDFLARRLDEIATELAYGNLEGRARPQRRLLEQERVVPPGQRLLVGHAGRTRRLELGRQPQARLQLPVRHVVDREESRRHGRHQLACGHLILLNADPSTVPCSGSW